MLFLITAIILLIVGLVKRSRHKKQLQSGYGGGYGGYGGGYPAGPPPGQPWPQQPPPQQAPGGGQPQPG